MSVYLLPYWFLLVALLVVAAITVFDGEDDE